MVVVGLANLVGVTGFGGGGGGGLEEMMLLSCWNLWNSVSKSMLGLLDPVAIGDGVEDTKERDGVMNCLVYKLAGLGVTATCSNCGL